MNITIRRAASGDIPGVIRLLEYICAFHQKARPDIFKAGSKKYDEADIADILADETRPIFVAADEGGHVAGYCFCKIINNNHAVFNKHISLYIDDLCVDERYRRRGIAKMLYAAALEFAKQTGVFAIDLNVWEFNEAAVKFYESLGFATRSRKMELIL